MPRRQPKTFRALFVTLLVVGVLGFWAFQATYKDGLTSPDLNSTDNVKFTVDKGESLGEIAHALYEAGLIKSVWVFKKYVSKNADDTGFQAGSFVLHKSDGVAKIVEVLTGPANEMWITILEGWRANDIAAYLADNGYAKEEEFLDCITNCEFDHNILRDIPEGQGLEGYLFPDTYIITSATEVYGIINRLLGNMESKFDPSLRARAKERGRSVHEILTMASLLEREVRSDKDRQIVAGILWKRLEAGMGLGVDASVLYALGDWKAVLDYDALQIDSPYNTRKYAGLPPGPICSPSLSSIKAALYPTDSPYWFYLTRPDTGEVIYSKNLDEHNRNVFKYLR